MATLVIERFDRETDDFVAPEVYPGYADVMDAWQAVLDKVPTLDQVATGYVLALRDHSIVAERVELDYVNGTGPNWFVATVTE